MKQQLVDVSVSFSIYGIAKEKAELLVDAQKGIMSLFPECRKEIQADLKPINEGNDLELKKKELKRWIRNNSNTIGANIAKRIFEKELFTLKELYDEFPKYNQATIRGFVNDLKHEGLLRCISKGKFILM